MALLRDFVKEAARGKGAEQLGVDGLAARWRGDYPSRAHGHGATAGARGGLEPYLKAQSEELHAGVDSLRSGAEALARYEQWPARLEASWTSGAERRGGTTGTRHSRARAGRASRLREATPVIIQWRAAMVPKRDSTRWLERFDAKQRVRSSPCQPQDVGGILGRECGKRRRQRVGRRLADRGGGR